MSHSVLSQGAFGGMRLVLPGFPYELHKNNRGLFLENSTSKIQGNVKGATKELKTLIFPNNIILLYNTFKKSKKKTTLRNNIVYLKIKGLRGINRQ